MGKTRILVSLKTVEKLDERELMLNELSKEVIQKKQLHIYFAKAALKIGRETFEEQLEQLGFKEKLPFDINMSRSTFSNEEKISSEVQLADSGYGQGQI